MSTELIPYVPGPIVSNKRTKYNRTNYSDSQWVALFSEVASIKEEFEVSVDIEQGETYVIFVNKKRMFTFVSGFDGNYSEIDSLIQRAYKLNMDMDKTSVPSLVHVSEITFYGDLVIDSCPNLKYLSDCNYSFTKGSYFPMLDQASRNNSLTRIFILAVCLRLKVRNSFVCEIVKMVFCALE